MTAVRTEVKKETVPRHKPAGRGWEGALFALVGMDSIRCEVVPAIRAQQRGRPGGPFIPCGREFTGTNRLSYGASTSRSVCVFTED